MTDNRIRDKAEIDKEAEGITKRYLTKNADPIFHFAKYSPVATLVLVFAKLTFWPSLGWWWTVYPLFVALLLLAGMYLAVLVNAICEYNRIKRREGDYAAGIYIEEIKAEVERMKELEDEYRKVKEAKKEAKKQEKEKEKVKEDNNKEKDKK
jgi:hypothetical protein